MDILPVNESCQIERNLRATKMTRIPSGRYYRTIQSQTARLQNGIYPQAFSILSTCIVWCGQSPMLRYLWLFPVFTLSTVSITHTFTPFYYIYSCYLVFLTFFQNLLTLFLTYRHVYITFDLFTFFSPSPLFIYLWYMCIACVTGWVIIWASS